MEKKVKIYDANSVPIGLFSIEEVKAAIGDGMVSDVRVDGSNLIITFNTDAGKEPITVPLSSIASMLLVDITYAELKSLRDQRKLVPGQLYRITDYVTTVNEATITNARSAGHQFDIIVRANSTDTLNEQTWAVRHDGDTYFKDARMEAWELKYRLDNVQWSKRAGTYVTDADNGYTFLIIGDITLSGHTYKMLQGFGMYIDDWGEYALMESVAEGERIICYRGDPEEFDPEETVGTASVVDDVTENGRGTITWMKDEHGNECPYDFKNIQYKRYMTTDNMNGRLGLGGRYMVGNPNNLPLNLSVEDTEDYIWAYTFSSDNSGGEQTDYSLIASHSVYDNVMKPYSGRLPDNVMFGENNHSNNFLFNCYDNSCGNNCTNNSWGNNCTNNSCGDGYNSNSCGDGCSSNSFGYGCYGNYFGNNCVAISWGNNCANNSCGDDCYNNSWGNNFEQSTLFGHIQFTQITTEGVKNAQVLNGVVGTASNKLSLNFAANKTYTQVAAMTSAGTLKIYVPGDLA